MNEDMFFITGAEGVGKSTIVTPLRLKIGKGFEVYDFDEVLRPYDLTESWEEEVLTKVFKHVLENKTKNKITVVAGLIRPYSIQKVAQKHNLTNIKLFLMDLSVEEQTRRLTERKGKTDLKGENEELVAFREYIKETGYPYQVLNTTGMSVEEITSKIVNWINSGTGINGLL